MSDADWEEYYLIYKHIVDVLCILHDAEIEADNIFMPYDETKGDEAARPS